MSPERPSLSDVSFFRLPDLTGEAIQDIVLLLVLIAGTAIVTAIVQRRVQQYAAQRPRRAASPMGSLAGESRLSADGSAMLDRMAALAGRKRHEMVQDALLFETIANSIVDSGDEADRAALTQVRRAFHIDVMNPNLVLVSTRQLLKDMPVRIVANVGSEKLDLYCSLLSVNEQFLLLDLPQQEDIQALLTQAPAVRLMFWREGEGETAFELKLDPVRSGEMQLFRSRHAMRSETAMQRKEFRLSVDIPLSYRHIAREQIDHSEGKTELDDARRGEGRLIDLSYSGAAFTAAHRLPADGFAQLAFALSELPVRAILEVVSVDLQPGGSWLVRGQFRGVANDLMHRIYSFVSREQVRRLGLKETIRVVAGERTQR
jgi:c-di-GMP-binding flagellar brake protein YcgR